VSASAALLPNYALMTRHWCPVHNSLQSTVSSSLGTSRRRTSRPCTACSLCCRPRRRVTAEAAACRQHHTDWSCCAAVECRVCGSVCATLNLVHNLHFSTRADGEVSCTYTEILSSQSLGSDIILSGKKLWSGQRGGGIPPPLNTPLSGTFTVCPLRTYLALDPFC